MVEVGDGCDSDGDGGSGGDGVVMVVVGGRRWWGFTHLQLLSTPSQSGHPSLELSHLLCVTMACVLFVLEVPLQLIEHLFVVLAKQMCVCVCVCVYVSVC